VESSDTIFQNARELTDAAERSAYLAQACGVDSPLRAKALNTATSMGANNQINAFAVSVV
jgi:hypothetical protein